MVAVGGGSTGSSSSSMAEWKLSLSLGGAGETLVLESSLLLRKECLVGWVCADKFNSPLKLHKILYYNNVLKQNCLAMM